MPKNLLKSHLVLGARNYGLNLGFVGLNVNKTKDENPVPGFIEA